MSQWYDWRASQFQKAEGKTLNGRRRDYPELNQLEAASTCLWAGNGEAGEGGREGGGQMNSRHSKSETRTHRWGTLRWMGVLLDALAPC